MFGRYKTEILIMLLASTNAALYASHEVGRWSRLTLTRWGGGFVGWGVRGGSGVYSF